MARLGPRPLYGNCIGQPSTQPPDPPCMESLCPRLCAPSGTLASPSGCLNLSRYPLISGIPAQWWIPPSVQTATHRNPPVGRAIRTSSGSLLGRCTAQASLYRNGDQHRNDSGPLRPRLPLVRTISCRYSCVTKFSLRLVMPPIYRKRLMAFTHIRDAWCGRAVPVPRY